MSRRMDDSRKSAVIFLTVLLVGVVIGYFGAGAMGSTGTVPSDQLAVAKLISVKDLDPSRNVYLTPVFISSGSTPQLSMIPLSFSAKGTIKYSLWEYRYIATDESTVGAVAQIFGPDSSGQYIVEIAKLTGDQMSLTWSADANVAGQTWTSHTWANTWNGGDSGWFYVLLKIPST